jgi:iron complex transport system ATP-binding protein
MRIVLQDIYLRLPRGSLTGLIGPNGSGKSSLLRCIYRALRPTAGRIDLDEADIWKMPTRRVARQVAAVLQEFPPGFGLLVDEVVAMGRTPHKGFLDQNDAEDTAVIGAALEQAGATDLRDREFETLSGGEKQRVLIARALAQQPRLLLLDEPTNHLDIRHQLEVLRLLRRLKISVLASIHDLNLAVAYCDHIFAIKDGRICAAGAPANVLTADLVAHLFGVAAAIDRHPATGRPRVTFTEPIDETASDHAA